MFGRSLAREERTETKVTPTGVKVVPEQKKPPACLFRTGRFQSVYEAKVVYLLFCGDGEVYYRVYFMNQ